MSAWPDREGDLVHKPGTCGYCDEHVWSDPDAGYVESGNDPSSIEWTDDREYRLDGEPVWADEVDWDRLVVTPDELRRWAFIAVATAAGLALLVGGAVRSWLRSDR